jgi:hypothetical protein
VSVSDDLIVRRDGEGTSEVRLQQMYRLTRALAGATTLRQVARTVCEVAPAVTNCRAAVLGLQVDALLPALQDNTVPDEGLPWTDLNVDHGGVLREAALGAPRSRSLRGYHPAADTEHRAIFVRLCGSDGATLGVLALIADPDIALPGAAHLRAVAAQVSQAIARAGLFEHEHRLAQRLQMNLLPQLAAHDAVQVAARYSPGSDLVAVGGDWYDLFCLPDGRVGLAIGDVAGHGLAEAAVMAELRNALRAFALTHDGQPGVVMRQLDRFLANFLRSRTATVCYLVFDPRDGTLEWSNAGHPPPLLVSPDGTPRFLYEHSMLLGTGTDRFRPTERTTVPTGSTLLLYTDGLVERRGQPLDDGLEFLSELVSEVHGLEPDMLCRMLVDHRAKETHPDDRALMVTRFRH